MKIRDVAIVGAGPCGSMAALAAVYAGLDVVLIDRAAFPRHKVCGDCLNPSVWPLLDKYGLTRKLENLPHSIARRVEFHATGAETRIVEINSQINREMVVKRKHLDELLVKQAADQGVTLSIGNALQKISKMDKGWSLQTPAEIIFARNVIVADGRNSTICRLLNLLPKSRRGRIGWQTHVPLPERFRGSIAMFFLQCGYGGLADCGGGEGNLCVVSNTENSERLKREACAFFDVEQRDWQSMSPIHRKPAKMIATEGLFLAGDAARVVEPFTGEGIYYAMKTGALAGEAVARELANTGDGVKWYRRQHSAVYRGRMWVNQISRFAGQFPHITASFFRCTGNSQWLLASLTRKVVSM